MYGSPQYYLVLRAEDSGRSLCFGRLRNAACYCHACEQGEMAGDIFKTQHEHAGFSVYGSTVNRVRVARFTIETCLRKHRTLPS